MKFFRRILGKTNKIENIYIYIFIFSILLGIVYGIFDKNYYKCCETSLAMTENDNVLTIFFSNFFLAAINLITAGISILFINFHTFSITSSYLNSQGTLFALPFLFIHGFFEMFGVLLFGLTGLSLFEKKILRRKSLLKWSRLLGYGAIFLLLGAFIEIGLFYLLK